jgi:hypothetical protein
MKAASSQKKMLPDLNGLLPEPVISDILKTFY